MTINEIYGQKVPEEANYRGYNNNAFFVTLTLLTVFSGLVYLSTQYYLCGGTLKDGRYIIILMLATCFLLAGLRFIICPIVIQGSLTIAKSVSDTMDEAMKIHANFCQDLFNLRKALFCGIIFGVGAFFSFIVLLKVWPHDLALQILLASFQFFVAIATGIGLYSLILFFNKINAASRAIKVSLFYTYSPEVLFVLDSTQYVSILAGIYVGLSMFSIPFSDVLPPSSVWVNSFIALSFLMVFFTYFLPLLTVAIKMRKTKRDILFDVERKIFGIYKKIDDGTSDSTEKDISRFDFFMKFRKDVIGINAWPFTLKWVTTTLTLLFSALLPVGINHYLP